MLTKLFEANSKLNALAIADAERAAEHQAALRAKRALDEELRRVKAEKADLENYALHELSPGVFVYARRPGVESAEPMHYLCAPCRNDGKKSILNREENYGAVFHRCPQCKTTCLERNKPQPSPLPSASPFGHAW
jgi:rubrerythrin